MLSITSLLWHALSWGAVLSVFLGAAFLALLRLNAEMWLDDHALHFRAFLKGTAGILVLSAFIAGVAVLLARS